MYFDFLGEMPLFLPKQTEREEKKIVTKPELAHSFVHLLSTGELLTEEPLYGMSRRATTWNPSQVAAAFIFHNCMNILSMLFLSNTESYVTVEGLFRLKHKKHLFLPNVINDSSKFSLVLLALHEFLSTATKIQSSQGFCYH